MNNKGFTLIELILVIAILGILAVSAMPRIFSLTDSANEAARDGMIGNLRAGIALYGAQQMATTGIETYPANLGSNPGGGTLCTVAAPCFDAVLKDPATDGTWDKGDATHFRHMPTGKHYVYDSATGTISDDPEVP